MDQPFSGRPPSGVRAATGRAAYLVQLLCDARSDGGSDSGGAGTGIGRGALPRRETLAAVARRCGAVEGVPEREEEALLGFAFQSHAPAGAAPPLAMVAEAPPPGDDALTPALQQTWDWPDAGDVARAAARSLLVSDLMATGLPPEERVALFVNAVAALSEVAELGVRAILWLPAQKLIKPAALVRAVDGPEPDPLFAPLNVRMFNVTGRQRGETVMDTIGLEPLGLPDVQCHFVGLPAGRIAAFLHSVARYLFQRGPVIESGHTVAGPDGERWRCRWEQALVAPARAVIDVEPTPPHAARQPR